MKNIVRTGWTRTVDTELNCVEYDRVAGDIIARVIFDCSTSTYEVWTIDYGSYEDDQRPQLRGAYANTRESINRVLARAEQVKHFAQSA